MSTNVPKIATQNYQQILNEALARIPVHNPEWTNFNDSDPGVTLIQLFAFMSESLQYRVNLMPDRIHSKFLRLIGVPRQPAEAAKGLVTFSNLKGALAVKLLRADVSLFAGQVPFRTLNGLDVLPVEGQIYYKGKADTSGEDFGETDALYRQLYASLLDDFSDSAIPATPAYYEVKQFDATGSGSALPVLDLTSEGQTVDGNIWVALLARKADLVEETRNLLANKVLTLAIVPAVTNANRSLLAGGQIEEDAPANLIYELPNTQETAAIYRRLEPAPSTNLLAEPGIVELQLPGADQLHTWSEETLGPLVSGTGGFPPSLEDTAIADRLITWIRIRVADTPEVSVAQVNARISYVGINGAEVTQRARVFAEFLGQGSGEPGQEFVLTNRPVIVDSVQLSVNGELWQRTDDLSAAMPEVPRRDLSGVPGTIEAPVNLPASKVFTVDRESGSIKFGNGHRGARPPRGAVIQASYDYGGGLRGMVGIGAITKGPSLPAGVKVSNPIPTWGGDEAESIQEAEQRIPQFLRHRDRLVSEEDFKEITMQTPGVDIGRVEVLPLVHPGIKDLPAKGSITLLTLPRFDAAHPTAPRPDRLFLDTVCKHLNPRRLITTEIHVRGPEYVPVYVSVGIDIIPGRDIAPIREAVKDTLKLFLSPLYGGFEGTGWALNHDVDARELLAVAARINGVAKVNGVMIGEDAIDNQIAISGLQLPHLLAIGVRTGDPQSIESLKGEAPVVSENALPIPVVPEVC